MEEDKTLTDLETTSEESGTHDINMGTLYDMNKVLVSQLSTLSTTKVREKLSEISKYIMSTKNNYYMLVCRDLGYYSLFHIPEPENYKFSDNLAKEFKACIKEDLLADFISIEKQDNGVYEVWVRMVYDLDGNDLDDPAFYAFYLFPYDMGLIEIKGE